MTRVRFMRQTSLGDYYLVATRQQPVTVRVSANYKTTVCLTCRTMECAHVHAVTDYMLSMSATGGQET